MEFQIYEYTAFERKNLPHQLHTAIVKLNLKSLKKSFHIFLFVSI